jgi:hypothetical protein
MKKYVEMVALRFALGTFLVCALSFGGYGTALAETLEDHYTNGTACEDWESVTDSQRWGETFTAGSSYSLSSVDLEVFKNTAGQTFFAAIYATSSNVPTGSALALGSITAYPASSGTFTNIVMDSPFSVVSGTKYALVFYALSGSPSMNICMDAGASGYSGGSNVKSIDSGGSWSNIANEDFYFNIYSSPAGPSPAGPFSPGIGTSTPPVYYAYASAGEILNAFLLLLILIFLLVRGYFL